MFGPEHPQYRPPVPAPAAKTQVHPLLTGALVFGGILAVTGGASALAGGVAYWAVKASASDSAVPSAAVPTASAELPTAAPAPTTALAPNVETDDPPTAEPSTGEEPAEPTAERADEPNSNSEGAEGPGSTTNEQGAAEPSDAPASKTGASSGAAGGSGNWWCTASSSVRVCGFAGACTYQMVFGNGGGKDRFMASQQAKRSCEASARAKGASAICVVQCSVR